MRRSRGPEDDGPLLKSPGRNAHGDDAEGEALAQRMSQGSQPTPKRRSSIPGQKDPKDEKERPMPVVPSKRTIMARYIVENRYFVTLTTLLTVFALIGDDMRLACTQKPADIWFDAATSFCLVTFSIEVILSCRGKEDYFLSFFFYLDTVSTVTLLLDITTINNELIQGNEEDVDNMRGFEAAQLAKAGRVVRVLRLVRILKLYKALHEAKQASKRRVTASAHPGDEDSWDDIAVDNSENLGRQRESRVGKKLSDMTTRRVILLVLIMLLVLPFLTADDSIQLAEAPSYGADVVVRSFERHLANNASLIERRKYELTLLQYIYYHNWFTAERGGDCPNGAVLCPNVYLARLFWVGIVSRDENVLVEMTREATIEANLLAGWEANVTSARNIFNYGAMPDKVLTILSGRWDAACRASDTVHRLGISLLEEEIDDLVSYAVRCPEGLRRNERIKYAPRFVTRDEAKEWHFAFYFDIRALTRLQSIYGFLTTAFVCIVLTVASIAFSNDANTLVLMPVEQMITKVDIIRENPLKAMSMADDEFKAEEIKKALLKKKTESSRWVGIKERFGSRSDNAKRQEPMETVILEKTIIKLGSLLALGFGEAGADIIAQNMHGVDSACVDAMVEGMRVECVIGCTRIRDFGIATQVLQQKVMKFVNQIAEILHGVADEFHGAANKNNGDTFLIVWRASADDDEEDTAKIADMSMVAFTKILGAIHRSSTLAEYRSHPGLIQRLGRHCRVNLSFGLHYGWAIEGAVGSEFKIDASYLSPNVSICESIEKATSTYGVSILLGESVITMCSPAMAEKCRRIDRVKITGSSTPIELYVIDLDCMALDVEPEKTKIIWNPRQRFRVRQFLEREKATKWTEDVCIIDSFNEHPDIAAMRYRYTPEFTHIFDMGYQNYSQGEWGVAQRLLLRTESMLGVKDGPSVALLKIMGETHRFEAPPGWSGWHELKFS